MLLVLSLCLAAGQQRGPAGGAQTAPPAPQPGGEAEDRARQAEALLVLSRNQHVENHALALETARQALALWQTTGDRAGVARAHAHLGRYHLALSDLPEAAANYESALRIWDELGDARQRIDTLIDLGFVEARRGEWASAISLLVRAQGLTSEADEPVQAGQIAGGLAYVFGESGLPEAALVQNQNALAHYGRAASARDVALTTLDIGINYHQLGDHDAALSHVRQALAALPSPDGLEAAMCRQYLAKVHLARGEHEEALENLRAALPVYERAGNPKAAEVRALMGQVFSRQGRLAAAREHYRQALAAFEEMSDRLNQAALHFALGELELGEGNYDAAEAALRQSIDITENVRRVPSGSDLTAAFSAAVHDRYEKYVECLMRLDAERPGRGHAARAFEASELARGRSLAEFLRVTQTNLAPGLDPQLAEREKWLRQTLRAKEDLKISLLAARPKTEDERPKTADERAEKEKERAELRAQVAALDAELRQLEAEYERVNESIRALHPAYGQVTRPAALSLAQVQSRAVPDDETLLLEFSLGEARSYAWAVTRDSFESHELPARARIEEATRKVYELLKAPPSGGASEQLTPALVELGRMLLAPVAARLAGKRRVIVVADGALHYVPFQVLPAPGGEPLVAALEVVNAPSASILSELREEAARRRPAAKLLAAFGNPVFQSDYAQRKDEGDGGGGGAQLASLQGPSAGRLHYALRDIELNGDTFDPSVIQPLFYARRELAHLLEAAAGGESFVAADFSATREQLLGTDLTQFAVLHFATHGILDPKRPENSGLVLSMVDRDGRARDGFVGLPNIYALRAPVNLVVLSACRTALGKDVRGEGLVGLTRGFMYAGASGVVASLWDVDDEATAELMGQFYQKLLREGLPPAEALRAAQNGVRQRPEWSAPHYWAAFTLQGEYSRPIKAQPAAAFGPARAKMAAAVVALLLLSLAGAAWWWWFSRRRGARQAPPSAV
jgi:CHAT domain-containing protein/tetratricopeptide (TPR) repeat protein